MTTHCTSLQDIFFSINHGQTGKTACFKSAGELKTFKHSKVLKFISINSQTEGGDSNEVNQREMRTR